MTWNCVTLEVQMTAQSLQPWHGSTVPTVHRDRLERSTAQVTGWNFTPTLDNEGLSQPVNLILTPLLVQLANKSSRSVFVVLAFSCYLGLPIWAFHFAPLFIATLHAAWTMFRRVTLSQSGWLHADSTQLTCPTSPPHAATDQSEPGYLCVESWPPTRLRRVGQGCGHNKPLDPQACPLPWPR